MSRLLLAGWFGLCALFGTVQARDFDYGLVPQPVAPGVYVLIGKTEDFDTRNGGNIVNTGFIVGREGVIVIDSGPSRRYGEQLRAAMRRITPLPPVLVINTHHHPDHFLGNQAFADVPIAALPVTRQGIAAEGNAFADNLYRLSGDWLKGTELRAPDRDLAASRLDVAGRRLELVALDGHTGADLVVVDRESGVVFAGDLVFHERAPTTPHADIAHWLAALNRLEALTREAGFRFLVPGHGPVSRDATPIAQTRAWLQWLARRLEDDARAGLDMSEVMRQPLPPAQARLPLAQREFERAVEHLFPAIEARVLAEKP